MSITFTPASGPFEIEEGDFPKRFLVGTIDDSLRDPRFVKVAAPSTPPYGMIIDNAVVTVDSEVYIDVSCAPDFGAPVDVEFDLGFYNIQGTTISATITVSVLAAPARPEPSERFPAGLPIQCSDVDPDASEFGLTEPPQGILYMHRPTRTLRFADQNGEVFRVAFLVPV